MKVGPLPPDRSRHAAHVLADAFRGLPGGSRSAPSKPASMADVESVLPRSTGPRIRARRCARRERRRAARHRDRLSGRSLAAAAALVRARGVGRRAVRPGAPRAACARRARSTPFIRTSPTTSSTRSGRPGAQRSAPEPRCSSTSRARRGTPRADPPHDERPENLPTTGVRARADGERELPAGCPYGRCCAPGPGAPELQDSSIIASVSLPERVLLAGGSTEQREGLDLHLGAVPEARLGRGTRARASQRPQRTVPCERTEGDQDPRPLEQRELARQVREAVVAPAGVGLLAGGGQRLTAVT